ncbi:MAG: sugar ABC transporter permease [Lachnospiraceae bacterium]|nr:sugar ABC transporter permease [Lachnospiraceae bacterium]
MDKFREYWNKPAHIAYLFIAPAMILLLLFNIIPLIASLVISTFDVSMTLNDARFVGLGNFVEAFHDSRFWNSMWVTIKWTLVEMPVQVIVALLLAALLTKNTWFNKFCRGVYFLPIICSATAVSIMWRIILNSNVGYITFLLNKLGFGKINFMNNPGVTFYVIVFMSVWKSFGISTIILVSAMQNVPRVLYEAAELDRAGKIRQFFSITLPGIAPSLWYVVMTRIIGSLQVFDIVYTTTGGGPNFTTETLVTYVYTRAFEVNRMGYATAVSECLFGLILVITICLYSRMLKQENE